MPEVKALFWDVGGVILSNGWDHEERTAAVNRFQLDAGDFEQRHEAVNDDWEKGRISFDDYLEKTVFYRPRTFSRVEFKDFLFGQSKENRGTRVVLDDLAASHRYLLATLNNESAEVNAYRIRQFDLRRNFTIFLTSCYLGVRKPDAAIYRIALGITQRAPDECIFIDDRPENLEAPRRLGIHTIHFQDPAQLARDLMQQGVRGAAA
jgi:putative hydrolase of the HAD superfamily